MADEPSGVYGGVDTHKDVHVAAAADQTGRVLTAASFAADLDRYRELRERLESFGPLVVPDGADVQVADARLGAVELQAVQQWCTSAHQLRGGDADLGPRTQFSDFGSESWSASQCQCSHERRQCLRVYAIGCGLSHQFSNDRLRVQGEQAKQKLIGFHYLYRKLLGALGRKVRCVERHERGSVGTHGRCQQVSVLWVAFHRIDQDLVALHFRVRKRFAHRSKQTLD